MNKRWSLTKEQMETGENIPIETRHHCELTVLKWMYKMKQQNMSFETGRNAIEKNLGSWIIPFYEDQWKELAHKEEKEEDGMNLKLSKTQIAVLSVTMFIVGAVLAVSTYIFLFSEEEVVPATITAVLAVISIGAGFFFKKSN